MTETNDANTARSDAASAGTSTTGIVAGGALPGASAATEEWNANVGVGSWITGGNLNTARRDLAGIGTSNSSVLAFGGNVPSPPGTEVAN